MPPRVAVYGSSAAPGPLCEAPLLLVNMLRPRRAAGGGGWRVYEEDLAGLGIGCALVAGLVAGTALLLSL